MTHRCLLGLEAEGSDPGYYGVLHAGVVHHVGKGGENVHTQLLKSQSPSQSMGIGPVS